MDQIAEFPVGYTTYDVLYSAFEALREIHDQMTELEESMARSPDHELLRRYGVLQALYEAKDGYSIPSKINRICQGLKIDEELSQKEFALLSGGEQTRVMLGRLLLEEPDVLLLDEPTNHLDLGSVEWLEGFLAAHNGTTIIISHDRYFLDKVVKRIVELVDGRAELYAGNYSYFVQEKQARYESRLAKYEQQQKEVKRLEEAAKRMHDWAQRADSEAMHKRAFNIEKRIERMEKTDKPRSESLMQTGFSDRAPSGKDLIAVQGLCKAYGARTVLDSLDFFLQRNERVAIVGANGSGKSTLLRLLVGEEVPDEGVVKLGDSAKLAYLP
ncbi:MAG: ATP-binding cassette domain-containing protein, partial [Limnochordia bacterium]|nr:ATP-binding cassette domain-containing protein [Limnochordia bacterium]